MRVSGDEELWRLGEEQIAHACRCLREACEKEATPYTLSVAVGYDELGADEPFTACQQRADRKLYADKNREKLLAARADG